MELGGPLLLPGFAPRPVGVAAGEVDPVVRDLDVYAVVDAGLFGDVVQARVVVGRQGDVPDPVDHRAVDDGESVLCRVAVGFGPQHAGRRFEDTRVPAAGPHPRVVVPQQQPLAAGLAGERVDVLVQARIPEPFGGPPEGRAAVPGGAGGGRIVRVGGDQHLDPCPVVGQVPQ